MVHRCIRCAVAVLILATATPAAAQRANENAVSSAQDAFGSSVGNERVGLYNPSSARGFSPIAAGNVRIQGLYFDLQAPLSDRLVASSTMRVGLGAQGYPFIAPTGIADFSLRVPGSTTVLSTALIANTFGGVRVEVDGAAPLTEKISVAGGGSYELEQLHYGDDRTILQAALISRWRPNEQVEIIPFWSINDSTEQEAQRIVFTTGFLPREIERRRLLSPDWTDNESRSVNYGVAGTGRTGSWTLNGGLFRSLVDNPWTYSDLLLDTGRDEIGNRVIIAERDRRFGSVSGELRASRLLVEDERRHIIHLTARGRQQSRRYGGGQRIAFGRLGLEEALDVPRPSFTFGDQSRDLVRQGTIGIGYQGIWPRVAELSLGLQRTWYRKSGKTPTGSLPVSDDSPWLMNGTVSVNAGRSLVFYAGYARGLEESPIAPVNAINRDDAPPAILTNQIDAGFRLIIPANLRLVAGAFDVRKPSFGLDNLQVYRNLGQLRNRGIEVSLSGRPVSELNIVLGLLLLDSQISGDAVDQGLVGHRPVDSFGHFASVAIDYSPPWLPGASFDLRFENHSSRVADRRNTFNIPGRNFPSIGGRYRFRVRGAPATLRVQLVAITNDFTWAVAGEGFFYNIPRRAIISLATDWAS
ncbi:MAG TPA: TonB-dependent receptor [Allosphingosinicella sp.]|jgi:iron complex outermembrane receptor protein